MTALHFAPPWTVEDLWTAVANKDACMIPRVCASPYRGPHCRSNVSLASVKARVQKAQFDLMRRASDLRRATRAGRDRKAETVQFNDRSDQT